MATQHLLGKRRPIAAIAAVAAITSTATAVLGITTPAASAAGPAYVVPASQASIAEFPVPAGPGAGSINITKGSDGNVWMSERSVQRIARVTPGGAVTEFQLSEEPQGIVAGSDGNLWFREPNAPKDPPFAGHGKMGRITPDGTVTEFNTPHQMFGSNGGIALGGDGNVWFLEQNRVARITPDGVVDLEAIIFPPFAVVDIALGGDGNIWALKTSTWAYRVTPSGDVTEFTLPDVARPIRAAAGPDGNVWFTDNGLCDAAGAGNDYVWKLTMDGDVTGYPLTRNAGCPDGITTGPDGNLWFTQRAANMISRMTPAGEQLHFFVPTNDSQPSGITGGADGKVWFTEDGAGQVGRLDPTTVAPPPAPCMVVTTDTTLKQDVGPCQGDGVLVTGTNLTLNLNGHKIIGGGPRHGDFAGIHLLGVSGVTVVGGKPGSEISGFDAGVLIEGGSGNVAKGLRIHDNYADNTAALLGDGAIVLHSAGNTIQDNVIYANGTYDNVSVLGVDSNNNLIRKNEIKDGPGIGIQISPFFELSNPRRGETISGNNVVKNNVHDNLVGINDLGNVHSVISDNTVTHNGFFPDGSRFRFFGNGIGVQGLFTTTKDLYVTVEGNLVEKNGWAGINPVHNHITVQKNTSRGNNFGIDAGFLSAQNEIRSNTTSGNATYDLYDEHGSFQDGTFVGDCGTNTWFANVWSGPVFPDCVTAGGHQVAAAAQAVLAAAAAQGIEAAQTQPPDEPGDRTPGRLRLMR